MMEVPGDDRESIGDERTARSRGNGHELAVEGVRVQPRGTLLATRSGDPRRRPGAAACLLGDWARAIPAQRGVRSDLDSGDRPGWQLRFPGVGRGRLRAYRRR